MVDFVIPEEQPSRDQTLISLTGWFVHDVEIRWVETKGSSGQTVSDKVDPQQLYGDQSFRETQGSSQEDGDYFTNVGGDQVTDELLHVVVNGTTWRVDVKLLYIWFVNRPEE